MSYIVLFMSPTLVLGELARVFDRDKELHKVE